MAEQSLGFGDLAAGRTRTARLYEAVTAPGSRARRTLLRGTDAVAERFITAVRSLDRILDEAKLFLAVRDELDGRARSGPSSYRPLRERLAD